MKLLGILVLPIVLVFSQHNPTDDATSQEARFKISVNGKKGFINEAGKVVIPPRFHDALEFSEGLCAVRIGGYYGFIDTSGKVCIAPVYDYASTFIEGLALVYLDGKPLFINPAGNVAFASNYELVSPFHDGRAYVKTYSKKSGIINREGKLVIDTIYQWIGEFENGLAIVRGPDYQEYDTENKKQNRQVSVIDNAGKMLFPYGTFESIEDFSEGYFKVELPGRKRGNLSNDAIIDIKGEVVFSLPLKEKSWIDGGVHNGIVRVSLPVNKRSDDYFDAYMTMKGAVVFADKRSDTGTDFNNNVAFVGDKNFRYSLINRQGKLLSKEKFRLSGFSDNPFQNGMAVVKFDDNTCGVIDTTASVILKTKHREFFPRKLLEDQYLFFEGEFSDSLGNVRYGLINLQGKELIPPVLENFDHRGFVNNLLTSVVDNKITYFNREGKKVWQDVLDEQGELAPLNIDYMNRGYYYANFNYTGHPGESRHAEPKVVTDEMGFTKQELSIVALPNDNLPFFEKVTGMRVEVANTTADTITFNAQDNRLDMKIQAKDKNGNWRDIEYLPSSWCGNSYHSVTLPSNQHWTFVAPLYEGAFDTSLRIALTYLDPSDKHSAEERKSHHPFRQKRELIVYSNEFNGSINPSQFWRRPEYSPSGVMDPYNE